MGIRGLGSRIDRTMEILQMLSRSYYPFGVDFQVYEWEEKNV
jgi:hypothetical protein